MYEKESMKFDKKLMLGRQASKQLTYIENERRILAVSLS
jgi:hypothetical protein